MIIGKTDKGFERIENEDNFFVWEEKDKFIMVVSDGMGGHNAGRVASALVVSAIKDYYKNHDMFENTKDMIDDAVSYANEIVFIQSCTHKDYTGMGATMVIAVGKGKHIYIGNVGDSRAYLVKKDELTQITEDHSYVNELVKKGVITKDEAQYHPRRNQILKAMGIANEVYPDFFEVTLKKDEKLLLCSDGLTSMVTDERILQIINEGKTDDDTVQNLIDEANNNGGYDNITVVMKTYNAKKGAIPTKS